MENSTTTTTTPEVNHDYKTAIHWLNHQMLDA